MQLLVSTPLQILLVDTDSGQTSTVRAGDGYYYGISCNEETLALTHFTGYLGFYSNNKITQSVDHLDDPHQVEWVGDDCLLVANSGRNCVSVFDSQGKLQQDVFLNDIRIDDKNNRRGNHFNSVHKVGDRVFVVAHNYEKPSELWELSWPDLQVEKVWPSSATWAHNVWFSEIGLVTCNTKGGSLFDIYTQKNIWKSDDELVLTRGLAVHKDHIFVGCSTFTPRKHRYWTTSSICILDRNTLQTIDKIMLPGSGEIREIRIVGYHDECHNQQIIKGSMIDQIKMISKPVDIAYQLRKTNANLQKDVPVLSQIVRFRQIITLWNRRIKSKMLGT
jgi:hypothetical protein